LAAPAFAGLTHGEQSRVPAPIYNAYVAARNAAAFYVCSDEKRKISVEFARDAQLIRMRYMPEFDESDAYITLPTHCPAPYELSDFNIRISAYRRAVRRLTRVLNAAGAAHWSKVRATNAQ
jgi:hypothetical protein